MPSGVDFSLAKKYANSSNVKTVDDSLLGQFLRIVSMMGDGMMVFRHADVRVGTVPLLAPNDDPRCA